LKVLVAVGVVVVVVAVYPLMRN